MRTSVIVYTFVNIFITFNSMKSKMIKSKKKINLQPVESRVVCCAVCFYSLLNINNRTTNQIYESQN